MKRKPAQAQGLSHLGLLRGIAKMDMMISSRCS
jgi:hypothetical protein